MLAREGVPVEDLAEINGLAPGERAMPGRLIFVLQPSPSSAATAAAKLAKLAKKTRVASRKRGWNPGSTAAAMPLGRWIRG